MTIYRMTTTSIMLYAVACAPEDDRDRRSARRDSAGVEIVEDSSAKWSDRTRWTVSERPILQFGEAVDGAPAQQFGNITAVYQTPGGSIGVLDSWAAALMFFDTSGRYVGRIGRTGDGPGEFPRRAYLSLYNCGDDTLYVVASRRVSVFTAPDHFVRSFDFPRWMRIRACVNGRFVVQEAYGESRNTAGAFTDSLVLTWLDRNGSAGTVIDTLPSQESDWIKSNEGYGYSRFLFGRGLSVAAQGSAWVTGFGNSLALDLRDTSGKVVRIARAVGDHSQVTAADIERFRSFVFDPWAGNEVERVQLESRLKAAEGRPFPAFAELHIDHAGNFWARRYDHLDAVAFYDYSSLGPRTKRPIWNEPRRWHVFDGNGRYLGEISTPARFIVHQIGVDWILGTWRDENDIQFVRKYGLQKPS